MLYLHTISAYRAIRSGNRHVYFCLKDKGEGPGQKLFVGAAVLLSDGKIVTGTNIENASYGNTICAERSTIFRAYDEERRDIMALATIARHRDFDTKTPSFSCGACRQAEFEASQISGVDIEMITSNTDRSKVVILPISKLLPFAFGPVDLGINVNDYKKVLR